GSDGDAEFLDFLLYLAQNLIKAVHIMSPIKTDPCGACLKLIGPQEGRQCLRHTVEHRGWSAGSLALCPFNILPPHDDLIGIHRSRTYRPILEHMGMPSNQFVGQLFKHILDRKTTGFCSDLTMKQYL